ncbi:hypothetical protein PFISCL1PPCAC_12147, partial [Pristionchus fissidentatus]
ATIMVGVLPHAAYSGVYAMMTTLTTKIDLVILHSHRFHDLMPTQAALISPLYPSEGSPLTRQTDNIDYLVKQWLQLGYSRHQLIVGLT